MEVLPVSKVEYSSSEVWNYESYSFADESEVSRTVDALAARLVDELKCAKKSRFSSGEVLLPYGLLQTIAKDILAEAEMEPCGLRGCTLYLRFKGEDRADESEILLGTVKFDRTTASTFEITLYLKQSTAGWNFIPIPQFLKKMARGGTVMIDSDYKLEKNKLYRSFVE